MFSQSSTSAIILWFILFVFKKDTYCEVLRVEYVEQEKVEARRNHPPRRFVRGMNTLSFCSHPSCARVVTVQPSRVNCSVDKIGSRTLHTSKSMLRSTGRPGVEGNFTLDCATSGRILCDETDIHVELVPMCPKSCPPAPRDLRHTDRFTTALRGRS